MNKKIITIVGKTNVGKSTLINNLSNKKISITTNKKNTTTKCITSNINENLIIIDTPGPIINRSEKNTNKLIYDALDQSNAILIVIDNIFLTSEDLFIIDLAMKYKKEKILVINKIDKLEKKLNIIPFIEKIKKKYKEIKEIIPISNIKNINITSLKKIINITKYEKNNQPNDIKMFIEETTRETLLNKLDKEIPYITKIYIKNTNIQKNIKILILELIVKKQNQKKIIIGQKGNKINDIINDIKYKLIKKLKNLDKIKVIININKK